MKFKIVLLHLLLAFEIVHNVPIFHGEDLKIQIETIGIALQSFMIETEQIINRAHSERKISSSLRYLDPSTSLSKSLLENDLNGIIDAIKLVKKLNVKEILTTKSQNYIINFAKNYIYESLKSNLGKQPKIYDLGLFGKNKISTYNDKLPKLNSIVSNKTKFDSDKKLITLINKLQDKNFYKELLENLMNNFNSTSRNNVSEELPSPSEFAKYKVSEKCSLDTSTTILDLIRTVLSLFIDGNSIAHLFSPIARNISDFIIDELYDTLMDENLFGGIICDCKKVPNDTYRLDLECCTILEEGFLCTIFKTCSLGYCSLDEILKRHGPTIGLDFRLNGTIFDFVNRTLFGPIENLVDSILNIEINDDQVLAMVMLADSFFKIPTGIMDGKLHWMGAYDLCKDTEMKFKHWKYNLHLEGYLNGTTENIYNITSTPEKYNGRYCRIGIADIDSVRNDSVELLLNFGFCISDSCSAKELGSLLTNGIPLENINIDILGKLPPIALLEPLLGLSVVQSFCGNYLYSIETTGLRAGLGIVIFIVIIVIFATGYDCFIRRRWMRKKLIERKDRFLKKIKAANNLYSDIPHVDYKRSVSFKHETEASTPELVSTTYDATITTNAENHFVEEVELPKFYVAVHPDDFNDNAKKSNIKNQISPNEIPSISRETSTFKYMRAESCIDAPSKRDEFVDRLEMAFSGFSAYSNARRVFRTNNRNDDIRPISGIRVLSYGWIVLGHTYMFGIVLTETFTTSNLLTALPELISKLTFQPILNFHFNTDTFLVISGCLVTHYFIKQYEANGKRITFRQIVYFYWHRYWKLVPPMALLIAFYASFYRFLGDGPMFPVQVSDAENCRKNWWVNILLVNNLVKVDESCLAYTWYLGILWQLHIITPLILIPLCLWPIVGYVILFLLFLGHTIATGIISAKQYHNGLSGFYKNVLLTPWCRAGAYLIGICLAIILKRAKTIKEKFNWPIALLIWVITLTGMFFVTFITYTKNKIGGEEWNKHQTAAYDALARSVWAIGVAWIILAGSIGRGGFVNEFLSWRAFIPIDFEIVYVFMGHLFFSLAIGFIIAIVFWYPCLGLERAVIGRADSSLVELKAEMIKDMRQEQELYGNQEIPPNSEFFRQISTKM